MTVKQGAEISSLHPSLTKILKIADTLWGLVFPEDADGMTVTSGHEGFSGDGVHGNKSKHYTTNSETAQGEAVDLRLNDVKNAKAHKFAFILEVLVEDVYNIPINIFIEKELTQSAHFHIELV